MHYSFTSFLLIASLLLVNNTQAQTKKIALRSHSGSSASFTFELPDEFGLGPRQERMIMRRHIIADSLLAADSLAVCTPNKINPYQALADSLANEEERKIDLLQKAEWEKMREKEAKKAAKKNKSTNTTSPTGTPEKAAAPEKKAAPTQNPTVPQTIKASLMPSSPPSSATHWLWLLLLPLALVFASSLKQP